MLLRRLILLLALLLQLLRELLLFLLDLGLLHLIKGLAREFGTIAMYPVRKRIRAGRGCGLRRLRSHRFGSGGIGVDPEGFAIQLRRGRLVCCYYGCWMSSALGGTSPAEY